MRKHAGHGFNDFILIPRAHGEVQRQPDETRCNVLGDRERTAGAADFRPAGELCSGT